MSTSELEEKPENEVKPEDIDFLRGELTKAQSEVAARDKLLEERDREVHETRGRLSTETTSRFSAEKAAVANAKGFHKSEIERLENAAAAAYAEGNFKDASMYNRLAAQEGIKLEDAERYEGRLAQAEQQFEQEAKQPVDPLSSYTPRTRQWIKSHPRFLTDAVYQRRAVAADALAQAEGHAPDTDEYFQFVEGFIAEQEKPKRPVQTKAEPVEEDLLEEALEEEEEEEEEAPVVVTRQKPQVASMAAPTTRSGRTPSGGSRSSEKKLTAAEAEMARSLFPDLPEKDAYVKYWDNKQIAIAKGKYN